MEGQGCHQRHGLSGLVSIDAPDRSSSALSTPLRTHETTFSPDAQPSHFSAHSHTTRTRQPASDSACIAFASRSRLAVNLASQNSGLVAGNRNSGQPSWRCQKHPCTKTTAFQRRSMMSGRPGRSLACNRNRRPADQSARLTVRSGPVSLFRIFDIAAERRSALSGSAIVRVQI